MGVVEMVPSNVKGASCEGANLSLRILLEGAS